MASTAAANHVARASAADHPPDVETAVADQLFTPPRNGTGLTSAFAAADAGAGGCPP